MAKVQLSLLVVSVLLKCALGGGLKDCFIDIPETKYKDDVVYRVNSSINDATEGIIQTFETYKIYNIEVQQNKYLNATITKTRGDDKDRYVNLITSKYFANISEDFPNVNEANISISISYYCNKKTKNLTIEQHVVFVKNHLNFDKSNYDFNFSMPIPKGFNLTSLQPIVLQDFRSRSVIKFTLEPEEMNDFLEVSVTPKNVKTFLVNLKALQDIPVSFQKTFKIISDASKDSTTVSLNVLPLDSCGSKTPDPKHPPVFTKQYYRATYVKGKLNMDELLTLSMGAVEKMKTSTDFQDYFEVRQKLEDINLFTVELLKPFDEAMLKKGTLLVYVKVEDPLTGKSGQTVLVVDIQDFIHPPVFSKNVYFGSYVNGTLGVKEPISISYGWTETTTFRQIGYEDFINITWSSKNKGWLDVALLKPFTSATMNSTSIEVGIEALNKGLSIPGKASLVVEINNRTISGDHVTVWNYSFNNAIFIFILFLVSIVILAMLNAVVLGFYFKKRKMAEQAVNVDAARS